MMSSFGQPEFTVTVIAVWGHMVWNPPSHLPEGTRENSRSMSKKQNNNIAIRKYPRRKRPGWSLWQAITCLQGWYLSGAWQLRPKGILISEKSNSLARIKSLPQICLHIPQSPSYQQAPSWLLKGSLHCDQSQSLRCHCCLTPLNTSAAQAKTAASLPSTPALTFIRFYSKCTTRTNLIPHSNRELY